MDRDDIPFEDIKRNMEELDIINTRLGGHKITIDGVRQMLAFRSDPGTPLLICELGCGGGDNLAAINDWCSKKEIPAAYMGIDINPYCIKVAGSRLKMLKATLILSDYKSADLGGMKPDIIFSSLFCHHFMNDELTLMLQWMKKNAAQGFFINDLHRHPLAYYSIAVLTRLFSRSYLVKNDAPLSVLRGFKKNEWRYLMDWAGIEEYDIHWKWAFRYLITVKTNNGSNI